MSGCNANSSVLTGIIWTSKPSFTYIIVPVTGVYMWLYRNYDTDFYFCTLQYSFLLLNYSWKPQFCCNLILSPMQCRDLQEFISLINQLIAKYKEKISPFLQEVFMPVVQSIATCLNQPFDSADLEVCLYCMCMNACMRVHVCVPSGGFSLTSACQYDHCNCVFWRAANCDWRCQCQIHLM